MQKHPNVLQYRASKLNWILFFFYFIKLKFQLLKLGYCTEQSDFYTNCQNLSPESELITIYRESAVSEKCPLGGLYVLTQPNQNNQQNSNQNDDRSYRSSSYNINNKCQEKNQESMIMECSDQSMLKLQFGKCTNMPSNFLFFLFLGLKFG